MKESKRTQKEENILIAAEKVFGKYGFKNAKMDQIAKHAGITKVTLYSYYQSKENLYMAITYKALSKLTEEYYTIIDQYKSKSGLNSVLALSEAFMDFCEDNYLYSETLIEYFTLNRSTSMGTDEHKLTEGLKESIYYLKLQDIQNIPFKLIVKEIERGKVDGSIKPEIDSMLYTLHGWTSVIGYIKIISSAGDVATPIFQVNLKELKKINLKTTEETLKRKG
ncbi:MAG TPA: TetR/AcrR family transcriptional regulator [Saprospiraceae bacterium]|mgnify:CR=1 FL=1|nr:TetR/AcrR family transcriptional regulator [Saprospiraceae bacterium]